MGMENINLPPAYVEKTFLKWAQHKTVQAPHQLTLRTLNKIHLKDIASINLFMEQLTTYAFCFHIQSVIII